MDNNSSKILLIKFKYFGYLISIVINNLILDMLRNVVVYIFIIGKIANQIFVSVLVSWM